MAISTDLSGQERAIRQECQYEDCKDKIEWLLLNADECYWCDQVLLLHDKSIDHMIPLSRGGGHVPRNLVIACKKCNAGRGSMTKFEMMFKENQR